MKRLELLRKVAEQTALDHGIDASLFFDGKAHVVEAAPYSARARKTMRGTPFLDIAFFGSGLVAVADKQIIDSVGNIIAKSGNDLFRVFDAPNIFELNGLLDRYGYTVDELAAGFVHADDDPANERTAEGMNVKTLFGEEITALYRYKEFGEALCYSVDAPRRDVIAVSYDDGGRPVAVAACSNDCEELYQIGVDVLPAYRRRGIATALVAKLTELIEEQGKIPFYRCALANIASRLTAKACGYHDAWIELFTCKKGEPTAVDKRSVFSV